MANSPKNSLTDLPRTTVHLAKRARHTVRNVAEFVRFGGFETDEAASPFTVEAEQANYRLRHYFSETTDADATPVLLIPPLMMATEVWDVSPATSAVGHLHEAGIDPWVVDFGDPGVEPGGLKRNLTDHVLAVSDAVDRVSAATGKKVVLAGYSQGGMFAYQTAAYRRGRQLDSLITFGSPVDTTAPLPIPIAPDVVARAANELVESGILNRVALPSWAVNYGFKMLSPAKTIQGRIQFLRQLTDREALLPREKQRQFLDGKAWTAYSGPAIAELLEQFVTHNRMIEGGFVIDDRLVTLADIALPILTFVGTSDTIGHPDAVRAIRRAAPRSTVYEVTLPTGHFGLVVGSTASRITWPTIAGWIAWRAEEAALPENVLPAAEVDVAHKVRPSTAANAAAQVTEVGLGIGRVLLVSARRTARVARSMVREAPAQLPRLARIQQLDPSTRISLGLLLDEQARRRPNDIAFLFGDRAHRQHDVKVRVDNVVKGLISIGVRHGDRIGVLMSTRPSAFTLLAALSRLGATAVMLRPDGELTREAGLGRVTMIVSDPDHVALAGQLDGVAWAVLGGGSPDEARADWRGDHPAAIDMERIVPDEVELPAWYRPNPHRAGDVAVVLFTGDGAQTKAMQITNRRLALSALGTASAAALKPGDTVYSVTPIHHSSALLMSIAGAVAGGARFALSVSDDPETFWQEVRRYGATHVSYTWTSLRDVVNAPANPAEQHHPIRMFIGSGMPRNLWKRVTERFPTTKVLEFYASAEGEAILANVSGRAIGSLGRPLPGTAEVRVAAVDLRAGRLDLDEHGLARECAVDEVGLLLARVDAADSMAGPPPMRSVFEGGDAWRSTGDLFLRDEHGDLWLAGPLSEIVQTADGPAIPSGARYALSMIPCVDLAVAYGVPEGDAEVMVAAITVRDGTELATGDIDQALDKLPAGQRPRYVQLINSIPVTTWHRPQWRPLQAKGVPKPGRGRRVWRLGRDGTHYDELT